MTPDLQRDLETVRKPLRVMVEVLNDEACQEARAALSRIEAALVEQGNLAVALDATVKRAEAAEERAARAEQRYEELLEAVGGTWPG